MPKAPSDRPWPVPIEFRLADGAVEVDPAGAAVVEVGAAVAPLPYPLRTPFDDVL